MKIAFFESEPWEEEYLSKKLKHHELSFTSGHLDKTNARFFKDTDALGIFIYSPITKEVLDDLPKLKFITTMSTGYDHIDFEECEKKGIRVANVPFYGENTVAEHTFALILSLSRKIPQSVERTKKSDFSFDGLRGFDLKNKTLGVIGTGHIGQHVIRIAKGFEMNVIAYDPFPNEEAAKILDFKYMSLRDLLEKSDIVTLHAPYNKNTHHLINSENIHDTKKGALIINTSRGGLIETKALIEGLNAEIISGAGLDVLEEEGVIKEERQLLSKHYNKNDLQIALQNHALLHDDRVLITPHNAFNSKEALERIMDTTVENIESFLKNQPVNLVKT